METQDLVIDTHWVLDLWAFDDPRAAALRAAIEADAVRWLACPAMRAELARVLAYPRVAALLMQRASGVQRTPEYLAHHVLAAFDCHACLQPDPPVSPPRCRDPDDQVFIDLAVAHRATLLSRDRAVLALAQPLRQCGVRTQPEWSAAG